MLTLIDPLYTRLPGGRPTLTQRPSDLGRLDYILLTHGHLDHARDFTSLALQYRPTVYATQSCIDDLQARGGLGDRSKEHCLDEEHGRRFRIGDMAVTPYEVGSEEVDLWFLREMFARPLRHRRLAAYPEGVRWLTTNLRDRCFVYHFELGSSSSPATMLYFGHLTDDVQALEGIDAVTVLALPFCPANDRWAEHSQYLINRFRPEVTLVHHFDDFLHPYTSSQYMNLSTYATKVRRGAPTARFFFSKFERDVRLEQIRGAAE